MSFFKKETTLPDDAERPAPLGSDAPPPDVVVVPRGISRFRLLLLVAVTVVNAGLSALLLMQHHGEVRAVAALSQVCGQGAESGCDKVAQSCFSQVSGLMRKQSFASRPVRLRLKTTLRSATS